MKTRIISLAAIIFFVSCTKSSFLDKDAYLKYVENNDNGLTLVQTKNDLNYSLTLCPSDYIIAKEFKVDKVSEKNFRRKAEDLKGFIYFKLKISLKDKHKEAITYNAMNEQVIKNRFEYLSYGFEENICIVRNNRKDTLPVALYHFERTYGISTNLELFFSFKSDSIAEVNDSKTQVLINDNIFNNVVLSYEFDKKKYIHAPTLKLY